MCEPQSPGLWLKVRALFSCDCKLPAGEQVRLLLTLLLAPPPAQNAMPDIQQVLSTPASNGSGEGSGPHAPTQSREGLGTLPQSLRALRSTGTLTHPVWGSPAGRPAPAKPRLPEGPLPPTLQPSHKLQPSPAALRQNYHHFPPQPQFHCLEAVSRNSSSSNTPRAASKHSL